MRNLFSVMRVSMIALFFVGSHALGLGCENPCEIFPEICVPDSDRYVSRSQEEACETAVCGDGLGDASIVCDSCQCSPNPDPCGGIACGEVDDGCGGLVSCGSCDGCGMECTENECLYSPVYNCTALGLECGVMHDECGVSSDCGICGEGQYCDTYWCESIKYSCHYLNPFVYKASRGKIRLWACHEYAESWGDDVAALEDQCEDFRAHFFYPFPDPPGTIFSQSPCVTHLDQDEINGQCYVPKHDITVWGEQLLQDDDKGCDPDEKYSSAWACDYMKGDFTCDH
jgi:hypothetical protein